ncbi:lipoate--protein ligase family protein [Leadbettera azotonutricia]|uniref:Lipoate--protein ligase n=1 Tax=Leadbettera azotonutricia (strain ATCC BAA-888 / DSM 13862 / ZAS-9) TaxID=545695 RepID=F5Y8V5_LEAAZ|nr:biotin/lipoate A/B protein ligase family protein [Leadbettera azotonutricia]AEF81602.1 lipoate--protein ligase [Leadbettera azotonutricia ZAS-9]
MAEHVFPWRLLRSNYHNAFYNMGLDEALLESVSQGNSLPVLRLYGWEPSAVSLGYFQGFEEEVDAEACARLGVDIVRRISGGGAVFHDKEITYSLILPLDHPLAGNSILESYKKLCGGIVAGLGLLGIEAAFVPINDILAGGRKVSGNAQTRRQGCVLQHGTILLDMDGERMFSLLKVPQEKMKGKLIQDVKARVTGLYALLEREISFNEAAGALAGGFKKSLNLEYASAEDVPTCEEEQRALSLAEEKFASPEWLRRR